MRKSILAALLASSCLGGGAPGTPPVSITAPSLAPNRTAAQGGTGTYNGTAGSGYSPASLSKFQVTRVADTTTPKRGLPVYTQPEQGFLGRVGFNTSVASAFTQDGIVAPIFHGVSDPVTDGMVTQDKILTFEAYAAALDGIAGGISYIEGYLENDTPAVVTTMTQGTIQYWGGVAKLHGLYQYMLNAASLRIGDEADAYFIAYPSMTGISPRIIGPYRFYRKSGYDSTALINPALSGPVLSDPLNPQFKDLPSCHNFYATNTTYPNAGANLWASGRAAHVRVTFAQNYVLDFSDPSATVFTDYTSNAALMGRRGRFVHDATGSNCLVQNNYAFVNADCKFQAID